VLAFYDEGLVTRQPHAAFMRHMAPDFVEHKPDVPDGTREATAACPGQIIADIPAARWEITRTIAERDMVSFMRAHPRHRGGQPMLLRTSSVSGTAR
jgi:predicted SnoaL-like aldol condensation-catalyzing enzyme